MNEKGRTKVRRGVVVSDKMDKTVVVKVENLKLHRRYQKFIKTSKKFKAHDESNECRIGDTVEIFEVKPLSKDKCWMLKRIIDRSEEVAAEQEVKG
ncbi:30S ribosomal protein S17 [Limisalsivibrio acetivorans]|uniref:30S ribosomal protein S17 n=1 Tax=Limisalsivibrio acetivorans TaxID=1304888 RepID=UPI0003B61C65|nr:30S ribosomal protein S17 [Limisalsivibrio acetivorans]